MKIVYKLILILFISLAVVYPSYAASSYRKAVVPAPSPSATPVATFVDSYKLFWPIIAGKVMGDPMYKFKSMKESVRETLIFGSYQKTEYNITLSEKRLVESEYLLKNKKDSENAKKSLAAAKEKSNKALDLLTKSKTKSNFGVLKVKFKMSVDKQITLVDYLVSQASSDEKPVLEEYRSHLQLLLPKLQ